MLSILLSSAIVDFFFVAPTFSLMESLADVLRFMVFATVALSVHYLGNRFRQIAVQLHEANDALDARVQERTAELTATNRSLLREVQIRQQTEAALRDSDVTLRLAFERVEQTLKGKEILLRELQHRVKNNLQVITSLLSLQRSRIQDPRDQQLFKECQQRIRTIALVHQRLCRSADMTHIDLTAYFQQLVQELFHSYFVGPGKVEPQIVVDETALSIDGLVPCALIVNELVCNSLKYAFPDGRPGNVRVEIHRQEGNISLIVADNGIGFSPIQGSTQRGVGLQIVEALVEQLGGKLEWENRGGTAAMITFPEKI